MTYLTYAGLLVIQSLACGLCFWAGRRHERDLREKAQQPWYERSGNEPTHSMPTPEECDVRPKIVRLDDDHLRRAHERRAARLKAKKAAKAER